MLECLCLVYTLFENHPLRRHYYYGQILYRVFVIYVKLCALMLALTSVEHYLLSVHRKMSVIFGESPCVVKW